MLSREPVFSERRSPRGLVLPDGAGAAGAVGGASMVFSNAGPLFTFGRGDIRGGCGLPGMIVGASSDTDGAGAASIRVPHAPQKRAPSSSSVPQLGHFIAGTSW